MDLDFDEANSLVPQPSKPRLILPDEFTQERYRLRSEIYSVVRHSQEIVAVITPEVSQHATEVGRLLQTILKNTQEFYRPVKRAFDEQKKVVLDMEHEDVGTIQAAKERLAKLVQEYDRQQTEATAKLQAEAQERLAGMQSNGMPLPVIVQAPSSKAEGKVLRTTWKARVESLILLVKAVAAGEVPIGAVEASQSYLNERADSDREGMKIPGVTAYKEEKVHFRS